MSITPIFISQERLQAVSPGKFEFYILLMVAQMMLLISSGQEMNLS